MKIQIALDPELGVSPEDFVTAWNNSVEASQEGKAELDKPQTFDAGITAVIIILLTAYGTGFAKKAGELSASALADQIKNILAKNGVKEEVKVEALPESNENKIIVVRKQ